MTHGGHRAWVAAAAAAAAFLVLPLGVFGLTVLHREGYVRLSALVAEEEVAGALRSSPGDAWDAAVLYVNFTRGAIDAQIYRLTVGQLVLSTALGVLVGLNLAMARRLRLPGRPPPAACGFGAGGGVAATLGAATAGAFGCCGGGPAVGLVAALGVSIPVAAALGEAARVAQVAVIVLLAANLVRLRRRGTGWSTHRLGA